MTFTSFRDKPEMENELSIREDIFKTITNTFGIHINSYAEIKLGYLNLKWKIRTNIGDLFVKQYNRKRYPDTMIKGLEISLNHQTFLNGKGIPCPRLFSHEGKYVLLTANGERFVLMRMCDGEVIVPGTASVKQLFHLGQIVGRMHKILNEHKQSKIPLHWDILSKESMVEHWRQRWEEANIVGCDKTIIALQKQRKIIEEIDLFLFSQCEIGWTHWDLFADNILFERDSVSAILDFDRMNYVYQEFDISRPILSVCLYEGEMNLEKVTAFARGFRETQLLSVDKIVRSIKLTWWKEATVLKVEKENDSTPLRRFQVENKWVADNWNYLKELFSDL
jgi:homoserine kinase type II